MARWFVRVFLIVFLAAGPCLISANANDVKSDDSEMGSRPVLDWLREVEIAVRIHANPLERTIVCRLPFTDVSVQAMSMITGHTKQTISYAATRLRDWGLVKLQMGEGGYPTIVPANEKSRKLMRLWAEQWCAQGDKCGVKR